jgi:hypothetical protein
MPLNFKTSFKRRVRRKPSEKCQWKTHFDGCAREVAGALELLARNRKDRLVFARVEAIKAMCDKNAEKLGLKKYSKRMHEDVLRLFREMQILSEKKRIEIEPNLFRDARFFNPHDMMTRRYEGHCVFIGVAKKPGTWAGDGTWQPGEDGLVGGLVVDEETTPGCGVGCGINTAAGVGEIVRPIVGEIVVPIVVPIVDDMGKKSTPDTTPKHAEVTDNKTDSVHIMGQGFTETNSEPLDPVYPVEPPQPLQPFNEVKIGGSGSGDDRKPAAMEKTKFVKDPVDLTNMLFQKKTGELPRKTSKAHRTRLRELEQEHGRDDFRGAVKEWIRQSPWDENTACHVQKLIDDFVGYLKAFKDAEAYKAAAPDRVKKEEQQNNYTTFMFAYDWRRSAEMEHITDEEKAQFEEIKQRNQFTNADMKLFRAVIKKCEERLVAAKAKHAAAEEKERKEIEAGNW